MERPGRWVAALGEFRVEFVDGSSEGTRQKQHHLPPRFVHLDLLIDRQHG